MKQFKHQATVDGQRRNAGKLYLDCPNHGRFGFDGKAGMQEYILENATIDGQAPRPKPVSAPAAAAAAKPAPQPEQGASAAGSAPAAAASAGKRAPWTFFG